MFKSLINKFKKKKDYENIVIFIFEDNEFIENRLELIRFYNPNLKIYGICTNNIDLNKYSNYLQDIFVPSKIYNDNKNYDLYLIEWFKLKRKYIKFINAHVILWNCIILDGLENLETQKTLYFTNLKNINSKKSWSEEEDINNDFFYYSNTNFTHYEFSSCYYTLPYLFLCNYSTENISNTFDMSSRLIFYAQSYKFNLKSNNKRLNISKNRGIIYPFESEYPINTLISKNNVKKIIIFIFHKEIDICINRLQILKKFNPYIDIYGIYGGEKDSFDLFENALNSYCKNIFMIKNKTPAWKWRNSDLMIIEWFKNVGDCIEFDLLYKFEWDMLVLDSLENIYKKINYEHVGLTGLTKIDLLLDKKWYWVTESRANEWKSLLFFVSKNYNFNSINYGCFGPGYVLPRSFLEDYSKIKVPYNETGSQELCNDELRLPLFASIFGYKTYDTGIYKNVLNNYEHKYFNCERIEIMDEAIISELKKEDGRRVFHPYSKIIQIPETLT